MTRVEIQIYDDEDGNPDEPLYTSMIRLEEEVAAAEERSPRGWYWSEGMDGPAPISLYEKRKEEGMTVSSPQKKQKRYKCVCGRTSPGACEVRGCLWRAKSWRAKS